MLGKQYSISLIRFISLLLIVSCHFMQFFDCELASWLNVGVQIFLCISGFLYGYRSIDNIPLYINKRLRKILVPYFIVFITVGILHFIFVKDKVEIMRFVNGLFFRSLIDGGEHLWFVPVILICYGILVLLDTYKEKYVKSYISFSMFFLIAVFSAFLLFDWIIFYEKTSCIICFIIGYCVGLNEDRKYVPKKLIALFFLVPTVIGNCIQIYFDYIKRWMMPEEFEISYKYIKDYNHVLLGVTLFILMKLIFDNARFTSAMRCFLDKTDDHSYECYLVHQFVILGPLSLMSITGILPVNIMIVLMAIVVLTILLKGINCLIP